jgi:hypothetical protein
MDVIIKQGLIVSAMLFAAIIGITWSIFHFQHAGAVLQNRTCSCSETNETGTDCMPCVPVGPGDNCDSWNSD